MAKKLVAVFVMCMVVLAAVHFEKAVSSNDSEEYKACFNPCHQACFQDGKGQGYTYCEMKCDEECGAKEIKAKLDSLVP